MNEFNDNRQVYYNSLRGTYVIFPLKYEKKLNLAELKIDGAESGDFSSYDMSDIINDTLNLITPSKAKTNLSDIIINNRREVILSKNKQSSVYTALEKDRTKKEIQELLMKM